MSCLGSLYSLDEKTVSILKAFRSDEIRLNYLQEDIEEKLICNNPERFAAFDKSWNALHKSLTEGKFDCTNGTFPLNHVIMGGEQIYHEDDYIMSLKTPDQVSQIADAVDSITKEQLQSAYSKIESEDYGFNLTKENFEYMWAWFQNSLQFWKKAATEKRHVLFTADL